MKEMRKRRLNKAFALCVNIQLDAATIVFDCLSKRAFTAHSPLPKTWCAQSTQIRLVGESKTIYTLTEGMRRNRNTIATSHSLNSVSIFFFCDTAIWRKHPKWIALENVRDRSGETVNAFLVFSGSCIRFSYGCRIRYYGSRNEYLKSN